MKIAIFITLTLFINQAIAQVTDSVSTYLSIAVPQRSGLASADFKHYRIFNDSLYVFYQPVLDTTHNYKLLESYFIKKSALNELDSILEQTDTLGSHTLGYIILGSPRFLIYANYKGRKMDGYISNCYREHIFIIVDWMNSIYPEKDIIIYSKEELIVREEKVKREYQREIEKKRKKILNFKRFYKKK